MRLFINKINANLPPMNWSKW